MEIKKPTFICTDFLAYVYVIFFRKLITQLHSVKFIRYKLRISHSAMFVIVDVKFYAYWSLTLFAVKAAYSTFRGV